MLCGLMPGTCICDGGSLVVGESRYTGMIACPNVRAAEFGDDRDDQGYGDVHNSHDNPLIEVTPNLP